MSVLDFVGWASAVVGAIVKVVRDVISGKTVPIDGAGAVRALVGAIDANDAAADKALDERFDKG